MKVFVLHGVHGAGKTFVSKPVAEDLGMKVVYTDAAASFPEVVSYDFHLRESLFAHHSLAGYAHALGLASQGKGVFLDFGPRHTIPYIKWFLGERGKVIIEQIERGMENIRAPGVEVVNVFFVIEKDPEVVIERIRRRARERFLEEELNREYLLFIDREMKKLADEMKDRGERVEFVPADAPIVVKVKRLWEIASKGEVGE